MLESGLGAEVADGESQERLGLQICGMKMDDMLDRDGTAHDNENFPIGMDPAHMSFLGVLLRPNGRSLDSDRAEIREPGTKP